VLDRIIIPGGFSYGDYLRGGALASHSPVMQAVKAFADKGGPVLGICNGFQILTESKLLPGILLRNTSRKFICRDVFLKVADGNSVYHKDLSGAPLKISIAHGEGRYFVDPVTASTMMSNGEILFRYCSADGVVNDSTNPNGAHDNIAGITSKNGRIMGLMPHPERAVNALLGGSNDGARILKAFLAL